MIINTLHEFQNNPVTPSDLRRKKKNKQQIIENKTSQLENDSSQMSEDDENNIDTTKDIEHQNNCETNEFQANESIQMSPIHTTDNTSNEQ
jgi:protein subunit release factor B